MGVVFRKKTLSNTYKFRHSGPAAMLALTGFVLVASVASLVSPANGFLCHECVDEMHELGRLVKAGANDIHDYLAANYCPTVQDSDQCIEDLSNWYVGMLFAVVNHYLVDGANHVCQTMGVCDAKIASSQPHPEPRRYTCQECVQGLEWVEMYLEDPIMVAEMVVYLEQNFCLDEWTGCKDNVKNHFPKMHAMAMEKFMIPVEICNQEPVCQGETEAPMLNG